MRRTIDARELISDEPESDIVADKHKFDFFIIPKFPKIFVFLWHRWSISEHFDLR